MQLTPYEKKMIERLRKQEQRWPRARWWLVGAAVLLFASYGYIGQMLFDKLTSGSFSTAEAALFLALFWPKVVIMTGLAGVVLGLAVRDWRGNAHRMLLLKLLDAHQKETDEHVR